MDKKILNENCKFNMCNDTGDNTCCYDCKLLERCIKEDCVCVSIKNGINKLKCEHYRKEEDVLSEIYNELNEWMIKGNELMNKLKTEINKKEN